MIDLYKEAMRPIKKKKCKGNFDYNICGLCSGTDFERCWFDVCKYCDVNRHKHHFGIVGCIKDFEARK